MTQKELPSKISGLIPYRVSALVNHLQTQTSAMKNENNHDEARNAPEISNDDIPVGTTEEVGIVSRDGVGTAPTVENIPKAVANVENISTSTQFRTT